MRALLADGLILALAVLAAAQPAREQALRYWTIPHGDPVHHWFHGLKVFRQWEGGAGLLAPLYDPPSLYYPPGAYLVNAAFGPDWFDQCAAGVFWLALLAASTYALTRRLWGRGPALAAALLVTAAPLVLRQLTTVMLDLPAAAATAACLALFEQADRMRRPLPSALFGLAFGAALLVKWTTALFIVPYLLAARPGNLKLMALAALGAALVAVPFYARHGDIVLASLGGHVQARRLLFLESPDLLARFLREELWPGFFLLLEGALLALFLVPEERGRAFPLWIAVLAGGLASLTLTASVDLRFLMPGLPLLAALSTGYLGHLKPALRVAACGALAVAAAWVLAGWLQPGAEEPAWGRRFVGPGPAPFTHEEVLALTDRLWSHCGEEESLVLVQMPPADRMPVLTDETLETYSLLRGYPLHFQGVVDGRVTGRHSDLPPKVCVIAAVRAAGASKTGRARGPGR